MNPSSKENRENFDNESSHKKSSDDIRYQNKLPNKTIASLEINPSIDFLPNKSHAQINRAFSSSNRSIYSSNLSNTKGSSNSLQNHHKNTNLVPPLALIESSHHTYPNVVPPRIKHIKKEDFCQTKILSNPKRKLYFKIFIICIIFIFMCIIGFIIFASLKPCSLTKCHPRASICINRFPFWAQCICDDGFAGNGKAYCTECGKTLISSNVMRIIGGVDSTKSSWPFAVYIVQNYKGRYNIEGSNYVISYSWSCGGTIINHKTILTAAHCIHDQNFEYQDLKDNYYTLQIQWNEWYSSLESTFDVYVGAYDVKYLNSSKRVRVKKVTKHEEFDEYNLKNDIAIIQLDDLIESTYDTQYACLPYSSSNDYPPKSTTAYIVGWGRVSEKGPSSGILKNSKIEIYNDDKCSEVEIKIDKNWDSQICAGVLDGSTDTCQGDSGGGLYTKENSILATNTSRFYVSGIVSYGEGCARIGKPGIYSRTSYFSDWIKKNYDF